MHAGTNNTPKETREENSFVNGHSNFSKSISFSLLLMVLKNKNFTEIESKRKENMRKKKKSIYLLWDVLMSWITKKNTKENKNLNMYSKRKLYSFSKTAISNFLYQTNVLSLPMKTIHTNIMQWFNE